MRDGVLFSQLLAEYNSVFAECASLSTSCVKRGEWEWRKTFATGTQVFYTQENPLLGTKEGFDRADRPYSICLLDKPDQTSEF